MTHELPKLSYDYGTLEPNIDAQTMEIHHSKHHQGYVDKLNKALEGHDDLAGKSLEDLLGSLDSIPEEIREAVRNNGGGHYNHSFFWRVMSPDGGGEPVGKPFDAINSKFGDFNSFKEEFKKSATGVFGSGWAWLVKEGDGVAIMTTPNQDSPVMDEKKPILGLDVWEHSYYLKHQNKRADYIDAWWNVVDWKAVSENFDN